MAWLSRAVESCRELQLSAARREVWFLATGVACCPGGCAVLLHQLQLHGRRLALAAGAPHVDGHLARSAFPHDGHLWGDQALLVAVQGSTYEPLRGKPRFEVLEVLAPHSLHGALDLPATHGERSVAVAIVYCRGLWASAAGGGLFTLGESLDKSMMTGCPLASLPSSVWWLRHFV